MSVAQELKQTIDIADVISDYVPLLKSGRNFKAICPFHQEKTPSFYVFTDRQSWHCFGTCGTGGDVLSFIMKKEGLEFGGALELLATRSGFRLAEKRKADDKAQSPDKGLFDLLDAAASYYLALLNGSSGRKAMEYVEGRGINSWAMEAFRIGYSPPEWDGAKRHLIAKGFNEDQLLLAGLLVQGEKGVYDRFRDRLMFPIRDRNGAVVGFGARSLDGSQPKYLNSPQTPLFDKSSILYGLDLARDAIRSRGVAVVVEGYMDVVTAHQYGQHNVIASMGTAVTEKQLSQMKGLTKRVALALDPDAAGQMASLRAIGVAAESMDKKTLPVPGSKGVITYKRVTEGEITVVALPDGKDPDDLIREDVTKWEKLIESGLPVVDFLLANIANRVDLTDRRSKHEAVAEAIPFIAEIPSPISQAHYLQRLAELVHVDERELRDELRSLSRGRGGAGRTRGEPEVHLEKARGIAPMEEYILALLIQNPKLKSFDLQLKYEYFTVTENRETFRAWQMAETLDEFFINLEPSLHENVDRLANRHIPVIGPTDLSKAINDSIKRMEERKLRETKADLRLLIQDIENSEGANYIWKMSAAFGASGEVSETLERLTALQDKEIEVNNRLMYLLSKGEVLQP
ncbi:MAG: DNA primase [Dehalococcoidia bacterium]|nr:DNA primase [Dehalococcoidia bacterium]